MFTLIGVQFYIAAYECILGFNGFDLSTNGENFFFFSGIKSLRKIL